MKTILILFLGILTLNSSCQKDTSKVCENLLKQGSSDPNTIKGEWVFERFAYSPNGKKIKNNSAIQKGQVDITDTGSIVLYHTNQIHYNYFLKDVNYISVKLNGSTYINSPQEELDIVDAIEHSKCYVVKENKLFIHYMKKNKNNVLVLNKK